MKYVITYEGEDIEVEATSGSVALTKWFKARHGLDTRRKPMSDKLPQGVSYDVRLTGPDGQVTDARVATVVEVRLVAWPQVYDNKTAG